MWKAGKINNAVTMCFDYFGWSQYWKYWNLIFPTTFYAWICQLDRGIGAFDLDGYALVPENPGNQSASNFRYRLPRCQSFEAQPTNRTRNMTIRQILDHYCGFDDLCALVQNNNTSTSNDFSFFLLKLRGREPVGPKTPEVLERFAFPESYGVAPSDGILAR